MKHNADKHIRLFDDYYKSKGQLWLDGVNNYWHRLAYIERNQRVINIILKCRPKLMLDVGCGTGDLILELKAKLAIENEDFIKEIIGLEPSVINANKFRENTGLRVYNNLAEQLPFDNGIFDLVIMLDVIEHVIDPTKALKEALRVIRKGGHLIITTPNRFAEIVWSFGSKRMFSKIKVKDDLFSVSQLAQLINNVRDETGYKSNVEKFNSEGIYPRSRILSWLFNPNSKIMMRLLRWLERFEILRYRQIVVIRKLV